MNLNIYILIFFYLIFNINSFKLIKNIFNKIKIHQSKIKDINGFYGMIGPDVNIKKIKTLYELFTGDGIIHGIFLENGKITQISHKIQTEKLKYESIHGKIINHISLEPLYTILNKIGLLPKTMGFANTAILKVLDRFFVLFERDLPYEVTIDFDKKNINTENKILIKGIDNFSAHSKLINTDKIYSIENNIILNRVSCLMLNKDMTILKKINVKSKYIPIIHDLWYLDKSNSTLFTDSPLELNFKNLLNLKIPVSLNTNKPTYIHVVNQDDNSQIIYKSNLGFYLFHYADVVETDSNILIYASIYSDMGFDKLDIQGTYCLLMLDKNTKKIEIYKNNAIKKYNLDFPIKWKNYIILRNIKDNKIDGFVICRNNQFIRQILLKKKYIYGEHSLYEKNGISRIMCFGYDDMGKNYFFLINPTNGKVIEFPLNERINVGFHSIFVPNPL